MGGLAALVAVLAIGASTVVGVGVGAVMAAITTAAGIDKVMAVLGMAVFLIVAMIGLPVLAGGGALYLTIITATALGISEAATIWAGIGVGIAALVATRLLVQELFINWNRC
jgi:hypothetical protein